MSKEKITKKSEKGKELFDEIPLSETEIEVRKVIEQRQLLGRQKYGVAISYKQCEDPLNWVNEAIEEVADQLQYLVALKITLEKQKDGQH